MSAKGHSHSHSHNHINDSQAKATAVIPEAWGTPLVAKTPINFAGRKAALEKSNKDAMKKLLIACFVSGFFIIV